MGQYPTISQAKDRGRAGHALVVGNFFVDTFQIVFLAVAAGGPPFVALCLSCSTLVAGLFMLWKKHKVRLFPCYPAQSCLLHHGEKRQSLPVEHGQPWAGAYRRLDSGNSSTHRKQEYVKFAESASEAQPEASYMELEKEDG